MRNNKLLLIALIFFLNSIAIPLIFRNENGYEQILPLFMIYIFIGLFIFIIIKEKDKGGFDIFHPLIFTGLVYYFPMFGLKVLAIIFLDFDSNTLRLLTDRAYYINLSIATGILAYIALIAGYYLPSGKHLLKYLPDLKRWNWKPQELKTPSIIIYFIGFIVSFYLFLKGGIGYTASFEGNLIFLNVMQHLSKFMSYGMFLAFFGFLSLNKNRTHWLPLLTVIILSQIWWTLAIGSRGYLFSLGLIFLATTQYSIYPKFSLKKLKIPLFIVVVSLFIGVLVGTTFREFKLSTVGLKPKITPKEVLVFNIEALNNLKRLSMSDIGEFTRETLIKRLDSLDILAVILNYSEELKSAEQAYGIDNNIIKNLLIGLIPRFMWQDKPTVSDFATKFARLYNKSSSEYHFQAVTVIGDLYRNFGIAGIIIGMGTIGFLLKVLYSWLLERQIPKIFYYLLYFYIITSINFEDQFSEIFTNSIRIFIFLIIAGLIVQTIINFKYKTVRRTYF